MPGSKNRSRQRIEAKAVRAQLDYIEALVAWDCLLHQRTCPVCRPEGVSDVELERRCAEAEAEKERLRLAFSALCDELGYVPAGHGVGLPEENHCCTPTPY